MKHKLSITLLLLGMFLLTQFIGLYVVDQYSPITKNFFNETTNQTETIILNNQSLPYGLEPTPEQKPNIISIIFAFILAFALISILMKYKLKIVIKAWFFFVVTLALSLTLNAFLDNYLLSASIIAIIIGAILAYLKLFRPHFIIHNLTEVLIYPGIAAVFIPILSPITIIILLILISIYDMWAVWKSGIMQKMAKYQMEELKVFGGFLVPSMSKKVKQEIKNLRQKYKNKKIPKKISQKKFKVNFAILGGGDVVFPIITSGVFYRAFGFVPALFVIAGAFIGLAVLFAISKKKAYPAMPYITAGIFVALAIWRIFFF